MENTKTGADGIHRAKLWQIGGFALNDVATNLYMFFMNYIAYYLTGYVGVAVVTASSLITMMRVWDGVTDPFIGYLVDKTNTKFGKNRPFLVAGNLVLALMSFIMVHVTHHLPQSGRFVFFVFMYMIYIIGYTLQCVVTKSAQTCLTNDPKQRPLFTIFMGTYGAILLAALPIYISNVLVPRYDGNFTAGFFHDFWVVVAGLSFILTIIAIISIAPKDRTEYFGYGKPVKIHFKDYWDVLKNNRPIQMLVVSASTDKLALSAQTNATAGVILYGIVCGNYALSGAIPAYTTIPTFLFLLFGAGYVARYLGQKRAMMLGTWGSLLSCAGLFIICYVFDPTTLSLPGVEGFSGLNLFTVLYLLLWILFKGFSGISGNIVVPMTADCADYEIYRSGKYVPGLMGALFSSIDKLVSSFSATIVGLMCAMIGFTSALPDVNTPYSGELKFIGCFIMFGLVILGNLCNVIAMKYYPLTKEKMAEIQKEIAAIKSAEGEKRELG